MRVSEAEKYLNYLGGRNKTVTVTPFDIDGVVQTEIDDFTARVCVDVEIPIRSNVLLLSQFFGDRNHSTVVSAEKRVQNFWRISTTSWRPETGWV